VHRRQDERVLAHAEIVVGAPDGDLGLAVAAVTGGARKGAGLALQVGEDPVVALVAQAGELILKEGLVVHVPAP
jgi:hypothetical protein